jgi:uncharacterized phage protein gp47/JayE
MADYFGSLNRVLNSFKEKIGLQNLVPGTKAYQIAESIAYEETIVEAKIDMYANKNSMLTATGTDLDKIGFDLFGLERLREERTSITIPMKVLKFYVEIGVFGDINRGQDGLPNNIVVPKGTSISGDIDGITYMFSTDQEVTLGLNESEKFVSAVMIQGFTSLIPTNTLTSHTFMGYSTGISKLLKVTNPSPISTGRPAESDDNYRYRISNSLRSRQTTTFYGIENVLLQVAGVSSVNIVNATSGGGTFTVFVQGTTPVTSDDVITRCNDAIAAFVPPWVTFNVFKPYYIGLEIVLNATVKQVSDTVSTSVIEAVSSLINNFGGDVFYINSILQQAQFADSNILDIQFDTCRRYSGADIYRVYEEVPSTGNSTIEVFQLEKLILEPIPNAIIVNQTV